MGNVCNLCLRDSSVLLSTGEIEPIRNQEKDLMKSIVIIQRAWRRHSITKLRSQISTQETH